MTKKLKLWLGLTPLPLMFLFMNCSPSHLVISKNSASNSSTAPADTTGLVGGALEATSVAIYQNTVFPILRTNCAACHGSTQAPLHSVADVTASHTTVLSYSLVNLLDPASSRLVVKINSGHNAISTSVAAQLSAAISDWSTQLAAASGGVLPITLPIPLEPTFTSINTLILQPKCVSCHGSTLARGGVRYDTYAKTLQTVTPGNANASNFYDSVTASGGDRMPQGSTALSGEEITVIQQWIADGALNN